MPLSGLSVGILSRRFHPKSRRLLSFYFSDIMLQTDLLTFGIAAAVFGIASGMRRLPVYFDNPALFPCTSIIFYAILLWHAQKSKFWSGYHKIFFSCRTWVQMMPSLVKGDDVSSETKATPRHGRLRPAGVNGLKRWETDCYVCTIVKFCFWKSTGCSQCSPFVECWFRLTTLSQACTRSCPFARAKKALQRKKLGENA